MVDLHCHILPGLDDGARTMSDSVAMARQALTDGIDTVCATPHIRPDHDVRIEDLAGRVAEVSAELTRLGVPVDVVVGGEVAQSVADSLTDAELRQVSLAGAGWLLIEPSPGPLDHSLEAVVDRLAARGAGAIVAHPERHADERLVTRLRALVGRGCLIQWTAAFVAEAGHGDLVLECARNGLVHVLGSDSHSALAGRPVALAAGYTRLTEVCRSDRLRWMAEIAPRAILRGERVTPPW